MKIQSISAHRSALQNHKHINAKKEANVTNVVNNTREQINDISSFDPKLLNNYYVTFTAKKNNNIPEYEEPQQFDNAAIELQSKAAVLALKNNQESINHLHIMHSAFTDALDFIDKYNKGETDLYSLDENSSVAFFISIFKDKKFFENKDCSKKFAKIMKEEIKKIEKLIDNMPKCKGKPQAMYIADTLRNDVINIREQIDRNDTLINSFDLYNGAFVSNDSKIKQINSDFRLKVNDILMLEEPIKERGFHFKNYDEKAENLMKNLNLNTNMFVTYDHTKTNPNSFIPSLVSAFENSKGKLNSKNTEIVEFNDKIKMDHFVDKIHELSKKPDKNYLVLFSQMNMASNAIAEDVDLGHFIMSQEYINTLQNPPKNVKFVIFDAKDNYLSYLQNKIVANIYSDYGEISIPVLNSQDVTRAFATNEKLLEKIVPNISKKALEKVVNVSSQLDGIYPDKTINLLRKIAYQYPDKKEITLTDVDKYLKDADHLFKNTGKEGSVQIVFDTGKTLKNIIGKTNTKKEAEYIVKQIKNKKIGTKGYIMYSQDGMVGGGRRHTAEAIAGEAKVPFVSINTMDFATKDVDLFGGSIMSPEASIKKLFSLVTTQAESNPNKSAVLFIENFEYFSVGEMISEYHQKAMAQLIREMENAEKKGLNIVVMGSVSSPLYMGEATMKSFKFNDNIEVSSPAFDENERYEVLKHAFKEYKIKLAGDKKEQDKLLKDISKTLMGFSFISLKSFVKKAESIALERGHSKVDKSDLVESYLRITTGRPSLKEIPQHEKELTTKHECGHAVTLQVMNDLMKKKGQPWMVPDTVNFITLDPRSDYAGAMYRRDDNNTKEPFEKTFSEIVCAYGGHSAEKKFFGMDGSWGITCDLNQVTSTAEMMVTAMGQGYYTGKISLANMYGEEDFSRNVTSNMKDRIDADVNVITKNALNVSDMIVDAYADFINEFADRYTNLVGTGDCLIDGDQFRKELAEWKERQSIEKQAELDMLEDMILEAIKCAKNGKVY